MPDLSYEVLINSSTSGEALDMLQDQYSRLFLAYTALKAELAE